MILPSARTSEGWFRRAVLFACALAGVFLVVGLVATWRIAARTGWEGDELAWLPLLAAFGAGSYLLRFLRWHVLVRRIAPRLSPPTSLRVYAAGFAMGLTPARVGELFK